MDSSITTIGYTQSLESANTTENVRKKTAGTAEKTSLSSPDPGKDSVTLSDMAKKLSKILGKNTGQASGQDSENTDPIEQLKKRIEELKEMIAKVQQSDLPEESKRAVVQGLESTLAALTKQMADLTTQAMQSAKGGQGGGFSFASLGKGGKV